MSYVVMALCSYVLCSYGLRRIVGELSSRRTGAIFFLKSPVLQTMPSAMPTRASKAARGLDTVADEVVSFADARETESFVRQQLVAREAIVELDHLWAITI